MVTIKDIADHACVSIATVSKVLNRKTDVGVATVAKVEKSLAELGYRQVSRGRPRGSMSTPKRTKRIGMLIPGLPISAMNSPVYMDVLYGVEEAVHERGLCLVLNRLAKNAQLPTTIFSQKVDGIILFGPPSDPRLANKLRSEACVQVMNVAPEHGLWDHVSYDNSKVGVLAADFLLKRQHKNVAFMSGYPQGEIFNQRKEIFRKTMEDNDGRVLSLCHDNLIDDSGKIQQVNSEIMASLVTEMLNASPKPTAVFLSADTIAQSFYSEMSRRHLTIGVDISVISCNNEELLLSHLYPRPISIDIHTKEIGRAAVEQLMKRIESPSKPRANLALDPSLVIPTV